MVQRTRANSRLGTRIALGLAAAAWLLVAGCFQQNPEPASLTVAITEVRATSNTSFLLRFSGPLGAGADVPENYLVRDPEGIMLAVVAAYPVEEGTAVLLATEPQADVSYSISVRNVQHASGDGETVELGAPDEVAGSAASAPVVADAVALSNTRVLVTFGEPESGVPAEMNDDALEPTGYGFDPALDVEEATFADGGEDRSRVILTTASMAGSRYVLQVGHVTAGDPPILVDPFRSERAFLGIAASDETPPELLEAYATDANTVVARFSEPLGDRASDPSRYEIRDAAGNAVAVTAASQGTYGVRVTLTTRTLDATATYTLQTGGLDDLSGNTIADGASVDFSGVAAGSDGSDPRVTGAASTGPTRVLVAFSEPVRGGTASAENPDHYEIVGSATLQGDISAQAILDVTAAELAEDGRSVVLSTLAQSEIAYTLRVTNVVDLDGNMIVGATREHPFEIEFFGSAETGSGVDTDGDGLTDAAEQRGWTVTIVEANGSSAQREVTSDPFVADTDEDGLADALEKTYRTDPRAADSDVDDLTDARELNETYSSPTEVDSDGDGLPDGLEVDFYGTSPRTTDTDGDQFGDDYEVDADNRNARLADLPRIDIRIGTVDLQLDVRFEEETSAGRRTVDSKSASSSLHQSRESAQSSSTSNTSEWFVKAGGEFCVLGGCDVDTFAVGGSFHVEGGRSGSTTTTSTTASVAETQREYAKTLTSEAEVSAESTVTRVVEGASMAVEVNIANVSDVGFTVRNLEVTALMQDPADPSQFVPIATLLSATGESVSIGPLSPERGPFRYVGQDVYPSLVEKLMRSPRGLMFKVANYDIIDEFGRNFAFVEEDVNDRTAYMEIDYAGNRPLEAHHPATNATFDERGESLGITMAEVMEGIFGLTHVPPEEDERLDPTVRADADLIDESYSTRSVGGVDVLWRVKDVSRELTGEERDWWVIGPRGNITPRSGIPGSDFRSTVLRSDVAFAFAFVQDLDGDGLEAGEELLYRSIDSAADDDGDGVPDSRDTDGDGVADGDEVYGPFVGNERERWIVRLEDGRDAYRTTSHPGRADSDGDGLTDCQELLVDGCGQITMYEDADGVPTIASHSSDGGAHAVLGTTTLEAPTDPANPDTDGDGLSDLQEAIGFEYRNLEGDRVILTTQTNPATPYGTNPLAGDSDFDGLDDLAEARLGSDPVEPDGDTVRDDDADGLVNAIEDRGWKVSWHGPNGDPFNTHVTSERNNADSDGDGLTDWEEYHGCRDAHRDFTCDNDVRFGPTNPLDELTDDDDLTDRQEVDGVDFAGDPGEPVRVLDPLRTDTDGDLREDGDEIDGPWLVNVEGRGGYRVWSDPLLADADGDGLNDSDEQHEGTDPGLADSDEDGALDGLEVDRSTYPLVPDHLVTVTYLTLQAGKDANDDAADCDATDSGNFDFDFQVRTPEPDGTLQLRSVNSSAAIDLAACDPNDPQDSVCKEDLVDGPVVVNIAAPDVLHMSESLSFPVPVVDLFTIEGAVHEMDPVTNGWDSHHDYFFGGVADEASGVYAGSDLTKGSFSAAFNNSNDECPVEVTVKVKVE